MRDCYCEMCDRFFKTTRTTWCPLCGDKLVPAKGMDEPKTEAAVDPHDELTPVGPRARNT